MMNIKQQFAQRKVIVDNLTRGTFDSRSVDAGCAYLMHIATPTFSGGVLALPAPAVIGTAADALAIDLGYTRRVEIEGGCQGGEFLIQPDTDLDDTFKAWGVDWQEWTWVHGCNVLIAECEA